MVPSQRIKATSTEAGPELCNHDPPCGLTAEVRMSPRIATGDTGVGMNPKKRGCSFLMWFAKILDASDITSGIGRDLLFGCARERIDDASS
jgi:hypothetical protein